MESKVSTFIGMITGVLANVLYGDLGIAVLTAFLTGGAAYIGQQVIKYIHTKIKKRHG